MPYDNNGKYYKSKKPSFTKRMVGYDSVQDSVEHRGPNTYIRRTTTHHGGAVPAIGKALAYGAIEAVSTISKVAAETKKPSSSSKALGSGSYWGGDGHGGYGGEPSSKKKHKKKHKY